MVMADGCELTTEIHDRGPTILAREDWLRGTDGKREEAFQLCRIWKGPLASNPAP